MKLAWILVIMTAHNFTLSEVPYENSDKCLSARVKIHLPYLATCYPKQVPKDTQVF